LRLVLWSLSKDLAEFPEAPPPGLVTVPSEKSAAQGYYAMAGYRAAGERAIRIDMLERLADMLRDQDTRGGFEATADMLSITGMTLEQFANLMEGLGYKAAKAEREKARAAAKEAAVADKPETRRGICGGSHRGCARNGSVLHLHMGWPRTAATPRWASAKPAERWQATR